MLAVVWSQSCPGSPSAAGDRAGVEVVGKELRNGEVQERDQCLKPVGRGIPGRNSGEKSPGRNSGEKSGIKKLSIDLLWMRVSPKISKEIIYSSDTEYFWGSGLLQNGPETSEGKKN